MDPEEFARLFERCSTWGKWGEQDRRGALNHLTPQRVAEATRLVRDGIAVSCARPLELRTTVDNPNPPAHRMTSVPAESSTGFAADHIGVECHGEVHSHLDALCHVAYEGYLYNGVPASRFQDAGGLEVAEAGITGRGVLLDIAALHGRQWLDPGHAIGRDELEAAQRSSGVNVRTGDIVLIRTGQFTRREQDGPWDSTQAKAGLDVAAMPWFAEREVSALGFDGDGDVEPSRVPSVEAPVHVLGITAMGLHFFDALGLDDLAAACATRRRYEFLFTAAPIRLTGATGCLINPLALF
ncbi:cyclase family protein [Sphaerisporangium sp. NPDC051011]|uniref:cyclase family protein n=1 Tax=Sphaerisporangium sp. NPDC051011 TaxID=3155792 RepID=UPI0033CE2A94